MCAAGIEVETATDLKAMADLAVADRLTIGNLDIRDVVFLVFPDELLSFSDGHRIPGVVGFPVIEAMGEIAFHPGGGIEIPEAPSAGGTPNLALDGFELLTLVGYGGDRFICRLDTGADSTDLYEPSFLRHQADIMRLGTPQTLRGAGVGGRREFPGYSIPSIELTVAGRDFLLTDVDVYNGPITPEGDNHLACNIGQDLLRSANGYTLNFRSMTLSFRDTPTSPGR